LVAAALVVEAAAEEIPTVVVLAVSTAAVSVAAEPGATGRISS
jgi:hypothetical protein